MEEKRGDSKEPKMEVNGDIKKYKIKAAGDGIEPSLVIHNDKPKPRLAMVPLFNWRSILVVGTGLIVGILIALGYWLMSPSLSSSGTTSSTGGGGGGSGLLGLLGIAPEGPYESKIRIQVVSPGSEYIPLKNLQQMSEYYNAKALSLPFFKFLNQKLTQQMPEFTYDVDKLGQMISTEYDINSELPIIKVTVVAATEQEAVGLAGLIPQDFRDYLASEEKDKRQKEYDNTLVEIENVRTALYQDQQELNAFKPEEALNTNPSYISIKAKVDALQQLVDTQASQLVNQDIGNTDIHTEYDDTLQEMKLVSAQIDEAKNELQALWQQETKSIATDNTSSMILDSKIRALQAELDKTMTGYTQVGGTTQTSVIGLAEMIANGDTSSTEYTNALKKIETTSKALDDAKKELNNLQNQSTQDQKPASPDYQIAQIKVDTLNAQNSVLQEKMRQLYQQILAEEQGGEQLDLQSVFNKTSAALAEAKKKLSDLESQLGYDRLATDLDYKIAQDKVNNLNTRLEDLTQQLGSLVGGNVNPTETDYLVAGNPTIPSPVLPARGRARNALIMGAIIGIVAAWGMLNYKWITKSLFSSGTAKPDGDGEEE